MELIGHDSGPMHGNLSVQMAVYTKAPGAQRTLNVCLKMHHLRHGVNAGIGATCAMHRNRFLGNRGQGIFEFSLYRMAMGLPLPPTETLAVIFDSQGYFCNLGSGDQEILRSNVSASVTCAGLPLLTISPNALLAESLSPISI